MYRLPEALDFVPRIGRRGPFNDQALVGRLKADSLTPSSALALRQDGPQAEMTIMPSFRMNGRRAGER